MIEVAPVLLYSPVILDKIERPASITGYNIFTWRRIMSIDSYFVLGYSFDECPNCGSVNVKHCRCTDCGFGKKLSLWSRVRLFLVSQFESGK